MCSYKKSNNIIILETVNLISLYSIQFQIIDRIIRHKD